MPLSEPHNVRFVDVYHCGQQIVIHKQCECNNGDILDANQTFLGYVFSYLYNTINKASLLNHLALANN